MPAMTLPRLISAALLLALSACGQQDSVKPDIDSAALQSEIKTSNLMAHLSALQDIANANGGNRAFGLPGYQASVDYIWGQISGIPATTIWKQDFAANFSTVESVELRISIGQDDGGVTRPRVVGVEYTPSTPASGIDAELVAGPAGVAGCNDTSYADLDVKGKIVLVERGRCDSAGSGTYGGKIIAAAHAGAAAVVVYNSSPAMVEGAELAQPGPGFVPAGVISQAEGQQLRAQLLAGRSVRAYFQQTQVQETRTTQNVFAETQGDPASVVMLGAHLDSVQTAPGINDDGSGTSVVLELFRAAAKYRTNSKLRFAWWGAEENGGLGSRFYCTNLTRFPAEADSLLAYLNFDMVARGTYFVGDGDGSDHSGRAGAPGSEVIEQIWLEYFQQMGIVAGAGDLYGGSDYEHFMRILQKPVGLLFTGAGPPHDPCYHTPCDNITNVNPEMLTTNAQVRYFGRDYLQLPMLTWTFFSPGRRAYDRRACHQCDKPDTEIAFVG